ncbi:MAG: AraC family transcriptional regulator [Pseudomonadota bacterium]
MQESDVLKQQQLMARVIEMHHELGTQLLSRTVTPCQRFSAVKTHVQRYSGLCYGPPIIYFLVVLDGWGRFKFNYDGICLDEHMQSGDIGFRYAGIEATGQWPEATMLQIGIDKVLFEKFIKEHAGDRYVDFEAMASSKIQTQNIRFHIFQVIRCIQMNCDQEVIENSVEDLAIAFLKDLEPTKVLFKEKSLSNHQLVCIRERIRDDVNCAPTTSELASLCGLSRSHFSRAFNKTTGTSPYKFVVKQRMQTAARILRQQNANVLETALKVGYNNPAKFASAFKREFGMLPRQWKEA